MASTTKRVPVTLTNAWQDICAISGLTDTANVSVWIQGQGTTIYSIVWGGSVAPANGEMSLIGPTDGVMLRGTSDHIWVKGTGTLTVHIDDN